MAKIVTRRPIHHEIPENSGINMVPLIDTVMQLLIFLMLTSGLARPNQIEVNLPTSSSGVKSQDNQVLAVGYRLRDTGPEITLNDRPVEGLAGLAEAMNEFKPAADAEAPRVDLLIEKTVPYQDVVDLMDTVRDAGFARFSLLTLAPDRKDQRAEAAPTRPPAG